MAESPYIKQWKLDNPEKVAAMKKRSYEKNKEKHKEARKAYNKQYRINNKESVATYRKQYKAGHIEQERSRTRLYRARIEHAPYDGWTDAEVYARDNFTCQICFEPVPMDLPVGEVYNPLYPNIDHIIGLAQGGSHLLNNVRLTHRHCNLSRTNDEERDGV